MFFGILACFLSTSAVTAVEVRSELNTATLANPIRKVVTMLQHMQTKVVADGKKQEELFDKFMCYCKTGSGDLDKSIADAEDKITTLTSSVSATSEKKTQTEASLEKHKKSKSKTEEAVAKSASLREKEPAAFAKEKADSKTNIAALSKAVKAIDKGMQSAFLQTIAASTLRNFFMEKAEIQDAQREKVLAFLSQGQSESDTDSDTTHDATSYAPASGEIVGVLKMMLDEMTAGLASATSEEKSAIENYKDMMSAQQKELDTLQKQIEGELIRIGDLGVELTSMKEDLDDTQSALKSDKSFLSELKKSCSTKSDEWEMIKKTRSEELQALAETIKLLNDDDALDLFKKTLPSQGETLLQVQVEQETQRSKALALLRSARRPGRHIHPHLDLIALALHGKKIGFEKIIQMMDKMVATLKKEQLDDDAKKVYCNEQFDVSDDKKKTLEDKISDSKTAIDELQGSIATTKQEIEALEDGIRALDKSVAESTEQRKKEHDDYVEEKAANTQAKKLLLLATDRMNQFYNPKLAKPAPALVQISQHRQTAFVAPPPPPETFDGYTKKSGESSGVIQMIKLLVTDLEKEMTEADVSEKDSQEDYEALMSDSREKRAEDAKALTSKKSSKASKEEALLAEKVAKDGSVKDLMATEEYIASLHGECDWLLKYFDVRREARTSEIDSLVKAKAVLNGADFSLVQTAQQALLRKH